MNNKDKFNNSFNTGNLQKDLFNFNIYTEATGFKTNIKEDDFIKFKQLQNIYRKEK